VISVAIAVIEIFNPLADDGAVAEGCGVGDGGWIVREGFLRERHDTRVDVADEVGEYLGV